MIHLVTDPLPPQVTRGRTIELALKARRINLNQNNLRYDDVRLRLMCLKLKAMTGSSRFRKGGKWIILTCCAPL